MEVLLEIDRQLFLFFNQLPPNLFLVSLMLFLTAIGKGGAVWFALGLGLAFLAKKKDLKSVIAFLWPLFLAMALAYLSVNLLLKPLIGRMRPSFVLLQTLLLGPVHEDFSFPSGHATSSFAAAFVLGEKKRKVKLPFYFLATLISFSRIYLGVHYPLDVLAGAVLGVVIGKASVFVDRKMTPSSSSFPKKGGL